MPQQPQRERGLGRRVNKRGRVTHPPVTDSQPPPTSRTDNRAKLGTCTTDRSQQWRAASRDPSDGATTADTEVRRRGCALRRRCAAPTRTTWRCRSRRRSRVAVAAPQAAVALFDPARPGGSGRVGRARITRRGRLGDAVVGRGGAAKRASRAAAARRPAPRLQGAQGERRKKGAVQRSARPHPLPSWRSCC